MTSQATKTTHRVVHFVDSLNGVYGAKLRCHRCKRSLPEGQFSHIGSRLRPTNGGGKRPVTVLHGNCHTCRKQAEGLWVSHPLYSPEVDLYWSGALRRIKSAANHRGILFALDKDDLLGKYIEQEGLCAYTGLKLKLDGSGATNHVGKHLSAASVDRIDSREHYTPDNIHIVMVAINLMKGDMSEDVFLQFCRQITVNRMLS